MLAAKARPDMTSDQHAVDTAEVWRDFSARLRGFITRRVSSPADVDDILQTVYLHVHRRLPSLRNETRLEAWLYRVTRNAIVDFYRSRGAAEAALARLGDDIEADPESGGRRAPPDESRRHQIARCLLPMVDQLAPSDREAIALTDIGDATMSEAAKQLGLSVPGAKSRVQRARARLRKMFIDCCRVELDAAAIPRSEPCPRSTSICTSRIWSAAVRSTNSSSARSL